MSPSSSGPTQKPGPRVLSADARASGPGHGPAGVPTPDPRPIDGLDLEAVRRRDPEALAAFFDAYFDRMFALVYRLLGDRTLAEDAAQEVFLKVHRGAHLLDPARDPVPWLLMIATNVCRDFWRSGAYRLSHTSLSIDDTPGLRETLHSTARGPEGDALAAERTRLVQSALLALREPLREVVVLREYEGLGYDQIAALAGLNEAAVRKRYSRALAEMGRHLKKAGL